MCPSIWLQLTYLAECIGVSLSSISNLILIFLILEKPRETFGNYKYLMLTFSILGIIYSCTNFWSKPNVHITKTSFIVFTVLRESGFTKEMGTISIAGYSFFYGLMLSLLCIQFYYRYIAVTSPLILSSRFSLPIVPFYTLLIIGNSAIWGLGTYILNGPTPEKDLELSTELMESYCLSPSEYAYTGAKYFKLNERNEREYHFDPFLSTFIFAFSQCGTLGTAMYFGIETYDSLKLLKLNSNEHRDIQSQLFRTLVIQTMIPLCLMYLPIGCLFLFPLVGWNIGAIGNFVPISVAIYPCFEPLTAMYCIKCFRKRIIGVFAKLKVKKPTNVSTMTVTIG